MNRMTVYDQMRQCFKVTTHQEPGRSIIQELGIYEDIHEEEIKKVRNITDIRDMYFTKGAKLDPYWENFGKPKTERSGWIPVTERLPEEDGEYFVTWKTSKSKRPLLEINEYSCGEWDIDNGGAYPDAEVIAWMPLPEPYKAEREGKE